MNLTASAAFGGRAVDVSAARNWLREQLEITWGAGVSERDAELSGDAQLVVSELVTNSVNAGSVVVTVSVEVAVAAVLLTVGDDAQGMPMLGTARPDDTHGRGLPIVAALAADWGVRPERVGKSTWVSLAR